MLKDLIMNYQQLVQWDIPDYFLLVQDYVNWAKREGILVGAGRGSSAGSLVSYPFEYY